jgi:sec-independent protein translocase protein TatB
MFDIGFSEIVVIMVVALIVIGPEKLPKVARTLGLLFGRAQRYVNGVRADIERDMQLDEVRKIKQNIEEEVKDITNSAQQAVQSVDQHVKSLAESFEPVKQVENIPESIPVAAPDIKPKEISTPVQQQIPID